MRFRGTLRQLYCPQVMESYLSVCHILLKDFGQLVQKTTEAVKARAKALAEKLGRPMVYVPSSQISKEEEARKIAARDRVTEGLICILNSVEPCYSFAVCGNRQVKKIELRLEQRKCSHFYVRDVQCDVCAAPFVRQRMGLATFGARSAVGLEYGPRTFQ